MAPGSAPQLPSTGQDVGEWETLRGWGGGPGSRALVARPANVEEAAEVLARWRGAVGGRATAGAVARGMGRSYGDAAQLTRGLALRLTAFKGITLHAQSGEVTAQAGVTVEELLRYLVPRGWMLPVVPGTQHVSVGGAIASDVHGKNHDAAGSFGRWVRALGLLTSTGEVLDVEPTSDRELFAATVGGMGLTGLIIWARIGLVPIQGPLVSVDTDKADDLDGILTALSHGDGSYRVAWLDLLGPTPVRGVVTRAEHVPGRAGSSDGSAVRTRLAVPTMWPRMIRALTGATRILNELRFRRAPRHERGRTETLAGHLFPLDKLGGWPRLYGPSGLVQYQFAVPTGREDVLRSLIGRLRRSRVPCLLATLKDLGAASDSPLSFPLEGWTLALDFPRASAGLEPLLSDFDDMVIGAGGRVYLTKDSRLPPEAVAAMYPELKRWREVRDRFDPRRLWQSDLALRTGLIEPPS